MTGTVAILKAVTLLARLKLYWFEPWRRQHLKQYNNFTIKYNLSRD